MQPFDDVKKWVDTTCSFTTPMRSCPDSSQMTRRIYPQEEYVLDSEHIVEMIKQEHKEERKKWWLVSQCLRYRDRSGRRKNSMQRFTFKLTCPADETLMKRGEKTCIRLTLRRIQAKTPSKNLTKRGGSTDTQRSRRDSSLTSRPGQEPHEEGGGNPAPTIIKPTTGRKQKRFSVNDPMLLERPKDTSRKKRVKRKTWAEQLREEACDAFDLITPQDEQPGPITRKKYRETREMLKTITEDNLLQRELQLLKEQGQNLPPEFGTQQAEQPGYLEEGRFMEIRGCGLITTIRDNNRA